MWAVIIVVPGVFSQDGGQVQLRAARSGTGTVVSRRPCLPAPEESPVRRRDEPALVPDNHRVHPIAQVQLREDPADMGLHRPLRHE